MPKIWSKKRTWYQARKHVCAKARLRNPDQLSIHLSPALFKKCLPRFQAQIHCPPMRYCSPCHADSFSSSLKSFSSSGSPPLSSLPHQVQGKNKTHKNKQICGIVWGLGGCQKVVYVFFFRVIPYGGEKKHINKIPPPPPKSRDNPVKIMFMCFFFMCFFRSHKFP